MTIDLTTVFDDLQMALGILTAYKYLHAGGDLGHLSLEREAPSGSAENL